MLLIEWLIFVSYFSATVPAAYDDDVDGVVRAFFINILNNGFQSFSRVELKFHGICSS